MDIIRYIKSNQYKIFGFGIGFIISYSLYTYILTNLSFEYNITIFALEALWFYKNCRFGNIFNKGTLLFNAGLTLYQNRKIYYNKIKNKIGLLLNSYTIYNYKRQIYSCIENKNGNEFKQYRQIVKLIYKLKYHCLNQNHCKLIAGTLRILL